MRFGSPLMSLAVSGDNKKLVVGFVDAALMVRTRKSDGEGSLGLGAGVGNAAAVKQQGRFYKGKKIVEKSQEIILIIIIIIVTMTMMMMIIVKVMIIIVMMIMIIIICLLLFASYDS